MTAPRSLGPMVAPQAVLAPLTDAAIFLVLTVRSGGESTIRDLLEDLSGLQRSVGFRLPSAELSCVTGIGAELWDRLFAGPRPAELHRFRAWKGPRHTAPATPGDLLFHLRAGQQDVCFEMAAKIAERLRDVADVVDETHGFKYFDERDLLGFVDGTENPTGDEAMRHVVIGDEDPDFAGGSYVMVQKYLHDRCCVGCSSATRTAPTTGSWTSPPRSPGRSSSSRRPPSSTTCPRRSRRRLAEQCGQLAQIGEA
jgi:porphyrinogen peroxidase